jgi:hypothetical protein
MCIEVVLRNNPARIIAGNIFRVNKQSLIALKHNLLLLYRGIGSLEAVRFFSHQHQESVFTLHHRAGNNI